MHVISIFLGFLFGIFIITILAYLLSNLVLSLIVSFVMLVIIIFLILFADIICLYCFEAREVIDRDLTTLFKQLRSECFKQNKQTPKVFIYQGNLKKAFILKGYKKTILLFSQEMLNSLSSEEQKELVHVILQKSSKFGNFINTISIASSLSLIKLNIVFVNSVFRKFGPGLKKSMLGALLYLQLPLIWLFSISYKDSFKNCRNPILKSLYYQINDSAEKVSILSLFSQYILVADNPSVLVKEYAESFDFMNIRKSNEVT